MVSPRWQRSTAGPRLRHQQPHQHADGGNRGGLDQRKPPSERRDSLGNLAADGRELAAHVGAQGVEVLAGDVVAVLSSLLHGGRDGRALVPAGPAGGGIAALPERARDLARASLSPHTRRAYAGALRRLDAWLAGRALDAGRLAAYLAELFEAGRAASSAAMAVEWRDVADASDEDGLLIAVRCGKTNPDGETADVRFVKGDVASAVRALRERRGDVDPTDRVVGLTAQAISDRIFSMEAPPSATCPRRWTKRVARPRDLQWAYTPERLKEQCRISDHRNPRHG